jgi:hypothetical protein
MEARMRMWAQINEAGVLLVSIKLKMMACRNSLNYSNLKKELNEIRQMLEEKSQNTIK